MVQIVAVSNQKGGVGKTTTSVNLAASLAAAGFRTLLIDLDPQRNASVGISVDSKKKNVYSFLTGHSGFEESIYESFIPNLFVMPSTVNLASLELECVSLKGREFLLKDKAKEHLKRFDFVFIDCPPSFGLLSLNAWAASTAVLVPLQCEYYALEGLVFLLDNILKVKRALNSNLMIAGVVLTMYDRRSILSQQIEEDVRKNLSDKVFKTVIPRNIKIAEAPSHGKPVLFYDLRCTGSLAYLDLAKEFLARFPVVSKDSAEEKSIEEPLKSEAITI